MAEALYIGRSLYLFPFLLYVFFYWVVTDALPCNIKSKENKTWNRNDKLNSNPGPHFWKKPLWHHAYKRKSVLDTAWSGDTLHFHSYICAQTNLASSPSTETSGSPLLLPVLPPSLSASKFMHGVTASACSLPILTFCLSAPHRTNFTQSW